MNMWLHILMLTFMNIDLCRNLRHANNANIMKTNEAVRCIVSPETKLFVEKLITASTIEVIKFPDYWAFVGGMHRWPVKYSHTGPLGEKLLWNRSIGQVWREVVGCRNWPVMRVPQFIALRRNAIRVQWSTLSVQSKVYTVSSEQRKPRKRKLYLNF